MPVQEALALGTPVICSPLPAIREFAADIPEYAEPHDGVRWLELIAEYAKADSPLRREQVQRIGKFKDTTWDTHFGIVAGFLKEIS